MYSPEKFIRPPEDIVLVAADTELRQSVDPSGTLPDVGLRVFEKVDIPDSFGREKIEILVDDQPVGWCDLITDYEAHAMHFDFITLDTTERYDSRDMKDIPRSNRPKGSGLAAYLIAIETAHSRGFPFDSQEGNLTPQSNRIWELLVEKGVATVIEQQKHFTYGDCERVRAKYRA